MTEKRKRRKNPCTKKFFEGWVKAIGKSCAYCVIAEEISGGDREKISLEDIVCDSVNSEVSFLQKGEDVIWYAIEKLEVAPRSVEEVLCDLVFREANFQLAKRNR